MPRCKVSVGTAMVSGQHSAKEIIMANPAQHSTLTLRVGRWEPALALALVCALSMIATESAPAQTLTVLHSFTGGEDGAQPEGLTLDPSGNLYGTTSSGGVQGGCYGHGCGVVFKLSRAGSGWT